MNKKEKANHTPDPKKPRGRKITRRPRENIIENHLVKRVKELGGLCWKFNSSSVSGVPDRIVILNGNASFIEVKRPGRKPNPHQRVAIAMLRRQGIIADYVDTKEAVDAFLISVMERDNVTGPLIPALPPIQMENTPEEPITVNLNTDK